MLEIINLLKIEMCSYKMKAHVASDVFFSESTYFPAENFRSQTQLNNINKWTQNQKMKLNIGKTKQVIFNFTINFQFSTRNILNGKNKEVIDKTKLLSVVISNDLKWEENTNLLIQKANARMQLLRNCATFIKD